MSQVEGALGDGLEEVYALIQEFARTAETALEARWSIWKIDLMESVIHEVVGGLLSRQCTLAIELARSPGIWNANVAPLILRCMCDVYITLAWILESPLERARKFVEYGLGQAKLEVEHRKRRIAEGEAGTEETEAVAAMEAWLDTQRYRFLTEVNLGAWSGLTTRKMAEEAGCLDFYTWVYTPFSAAVHSQWDHIVRLNLELCANPLHKFHRRPVVRQFGPDANYFHLAAKYLEKALQLFDAKCGVVCEARSPLKTLESGLARIADTHVAREDEPSDADLRAASPRQS